MAGTNTILGGGGFHHVAMRVANFDETVGFYRDVLGFREAKAWGEGAKRAVMLDTGDGGCLEVFAGGAQKPAVAADAAGRPEGPVIHFALRASDVDAAIARVRAAGATVTVEPKNVDIPSQPPLPVRLAFFKGPAGEIVELFHERG